MNEDKSYYEVKLKIVYRGTIKAQEAEDEKFKAVSEKYLVQAVSVTDAEKIVHNDFKNFTGEFEIESVSKSRIVKVI